MRKYKLLPGKHWSSFNPGDVITDADIPVGRKVEDLIAMGVVIPHDGDFPAPLDKNDAEGWARRAKALEAENQELRVASVDAKTIAEINELRKAKEESDALVRRLQDYNAEALQGTVPLADHRNTEDQLRQAQELAKKQAEAIEDLKAKLQPESAAAVTPEKK